jgi:Fe-Mn family superoxide dismutase
MVLHEYYFENLISGGTKLSDGELKKAIEKKWGSYEKWEMDFVATGKSRGIGWAILYAKEKNLINNFIISHDYGHIAGYKPILVMDVWEHAYMVDHKASGRGDYIAAFMKNINWQIVEVRF